MNSEELTQPLKEPMSDAPTTQPLVKEMLVDIRELKDAVATLTALVQQLVQQGARIEQRLDRVEQRLDRVEQRLDRVEQRLDRVEQRLEGIEREQTLMRIGMDKIHANALRHEERITMLEREFEERYKIAA
jgi:chromosome segregation ATPase